MSKRKILLWILAGVTFAAGGYWIFRPAAIAVETASVAKGHFLVAIDEDGRTRIRDRFAVSAPLSGRLSRISLRPGDHVEEGQALASLQPLLPPLRDLRARKELEERVGAAEASLEEANTTHERFRLALAKSKIDHTRAKQLREKGVISEAQVERDTYTFEAAERDAIAAERRRHAAIHALAEARAALQLTAEPDNPSTEKLSVAAPVAGRVLRVHQESEAAVNAGAPLIEIGDPANIEVITDVLTTDAVRIVPGANVTIGRWGGDVPLKGKVKRVEPSGFTKTSALGVEEQRVWVVIDIVSPADLWRNLGDGFRVEVNIVVDELHDAIIVPSGSLFRRGDDWFIFVVADGRATVRRVDVQRRSGKLAVIILPNLALGDRVVTFPPSTLKDGARIRELNP